MKLVILSDTHDNIWAFDEAIPVLSQGEVILHCGDLCSPFMIPRLAEAAAGRPVHIVWGNNDGDKRLLMVQANNVGNVRIHGELAELDLGGLRVAINHYPEIGRALASGETYDLVCYGHDHIANHEKIGQTDLINPGEMMGLKGKRTLVVFDTATRSVEWVEI
jgi:putative phosphoesterase